MGHRIGTEDNKARKLELPLQYLKDITNNFSSDREIGRGGFGVVYKGIEPQSEVVIAVKKLKPILGEQDKQFKNEVNHLARLSHDNIVKLVGYCDETKERAVYDEYQQKYILAEVQDKLLCYEYMSKGSLDNYIYDESNGLDWQDRYKIIYGICQGLYCLHEGLDNTPIIHMDLKPPNILLDDRMVPKIADFGLSRLFSKEQTRTCTMNIMGSIGYMAPEYLYDGEISTKSDIYSLGILILEVVIGKKNSQVAGNRSGEHFIENVRKNWTKISQIASKHPALGTDCHRQVHRCIEIGLRCVETKPETRPSAAQILLHIFSGKSTRVDQNPYENGFFHRLIFGTTRRQTPPLLKYNTSPPTWAEVEFYVLPESDTGTFFRRGCVPVLDTLGSSMTNLNRGSGFLSGGNNRGNKASILAFEVANTIAKASSLWRSCSDESIEELKKEILHSDGVRILVSSNTIELLHIAAIDKREELAIFSREVIRFGNLCKDPMWQNLGRYFDKYASRKLVTDNTPQEHSKKSMEATVQKLINLAQNTAELYHELHALDRFEQDFKRKFHEEESVPAARRESLMTLHSELKRQRKLVKNLKKKSLWSITLEDIVEKLVDIVIFLYKQIRDSFDEAGIEFSASEQTLNSCGLALHYANIINQIENIVSQPLSLPPSARDNLYHGLPITVKSALRSRVQTYNTEEERTVAQIKAEMQKTLRWLLPVAENTIRAHQCFGWVGEWANLWSDRSKKSGWASDSLTRAHQGFGWVYDEAILWSGMIKKSGSQHSIIRIQTLHHADKAKTEHYMLELVVLLHHLVTQVKNRGYGTSKSSRSPVNSCVASSPLSDCERAGLDHLSFKRTSYGRSQSCEPPPGRQNKAHRSWDSCRSQGSSPAREFGRTPVGDREQRT